jgi:pimeloyl-ACP methyl ester carboxylesterase
LIHGLGSSGRDWELQVPEFSKHFKVITYDVRGCGYSNKAPGPYDALQFAADLKKLMDTLEIKSTHILGLSMGGMIAFQFAVDNPERVKSLVIVNSWVDFNPRNFKERLKLWRRTIVFRLFSMRKIGEVLSKQLFIYPDQEVFREKMVERWVDNHKPTYMAVMRGIVGWSIADRVNEITCPTLVIAADDDYTPLDNKQEYTAQLPNAELVVIEDSRHAVSMEKYEEFNQVVMSFFEKIS